MCTDNVNTTSSLSTRDSILSTVFFCLLHGYIYISCHIGKCKQTSEQCLNIIKKSYIGSFSDVLVIFALITVSGNVHRPCDSTPNIVSNCLQHAYSFLLIIPDFLIRFSLLTILGNAHRPCKQYTNIVDDGLHHIFLFFSDFF